MSGCGNIKNALESFVIGFFSYVQKNHHDNGELKIEAVSLHDEDRLEGVLDPVCATETQEIKFQEKI